MARIFFETRDLPTGGRRRPAWPERADAHGDPASGDFVPAMDVVETEAAVEILLDLPGVAAEAVSITSKDGVLLVAGTKAPTRCQHGQAAFHLAERAFGRFSRGVRLAGSFDVRRASSTFVAGELRIVLPRLAERRGAAINIAVGRTDPGVAEPGA